MNKEVKMPRAAIFNSAQECLWQICDMLSDTIIEINKYKMPEDDRMGALNETLSALYTLAWNTAGHIEDVDNMDESHIKEEEGETEWKSY